MNCPSVFNNEEYENVPCPLCGRRDHDVLYEQFTPYKIVRCRACKLCYLTPRKIEKIMSTVYQNEKYFANDSIGYVNYADQESTLRKTFRQFMIDLKKHNLTGGALLDVGCGYGYLLEEARGYFDVRVGIDISQKAVEFARKKADHVYLGELTKLPPDEKYDCIIATHVIEHIYHPNAFVKDLISYLKIGGKMIIATPYMGSFWQRLMGHRWPSFKLPEHVLFFDKRTLYYLMKQYNFSKLFFIPYSHAFPLSLVSAKLHVPVLSWFKRLTVWVPATTIAICGVLKDE